MRNRSPTFRGKFLPLRRKNLDPLSPAFTGAARCAGGKKLRRLNRAYLVIIIKERSSKRIYILFDAFLSISRALRTCYALHPIHIYIWFRRLHARQKFSSVAHVIPASLFSRLFLRRPVSYLLVTISAHFPPSIHPFPRARPFPCPFFSPPLPSPPRTTSLITTYFNTIQRRVTPTIEGIAINA